LLPVLKAPSYFLKMTMYESFLSNLFLSAFFYPKTLTAVCVGILALLSFALYRLGTMKRDLQKLSRLLAVYRETADGLPDGYFLWIYDSVGFIAHTRCSRRLAVMLNLFAGTETSFDALLERFSPACAETLAEAVRDMRREDRPFSMEVRNADGTKHFAVAGFRSLGPGNAPLADILWIRDTTEDDRRLSSLTAEAEEMKKQNTFLEQALDSFPFPIWMRNEDLQLFFCNPAYARAVHAPSKEQAILSGTELVYEKSPREARVLAAAARAAGKEHNAREFVVMNGRRRRIEVSEIPLPASGESFRSKTLGFVRDITREEDLRQSLEDHIRSHNGVLEHLKTAVAVFDMETRLQFYNTSFLNLWDLEEEWLDGSPTYAHFLDILREKRRLPENRDFSAYKAREIQYFSTLVSAQEDIMHLPSGVTLRRMLIPHPLGGLLITYEDVTGHLTMERSMTVLNETQCMLINQMREAILVFGSDGRLRLANAAYRTLWQFDPGEFRKSAPSIPEVLEKQRSFFEAEKNWESLKEQLLGVLTAHTGEIFQIMRSDGRVLEFMSLGLPDGGIFASFFDVTEEEKSSLLLKEKENLFSHYRQTAVQTDRLRSLFLEQLGNEMAPPLRILGEASAALLGPKGKGLTKQQKTLLQSVSESSEDIRSLLSDMTDLAQIESGTSILELDSVDVPALLNAAVRAVRERAKAKGITVALKVEDGLPALIADKKRLKQVLYYLLNNAVASSFKNGTVGLTAEAVEEDSGRRLRISVSETSLNLNGETETVNFAAQDGFASSLISALIEMHGGELQISDKNGTKETQILLPCR
jgi:signal transduction histidine kinase